MSQPRRNADWGIDDVFKKDEMLVSSLVVPVTTSTARARVLGYRSREVHCVNIPKVSEYDRRSRSCCPRYLVRSSAGP